jgi:hypothetical protein
MNTKVTLPSGAVLEIQTAPFETVMDAIQVIARELAKVELKIDPETIRAVQAGGTAGAGDLDVSTLKDAVLTLVASREFRPALAELMKSAMYNGLKVDATTWQSEEARGDYFPAAWEVIKKNIAPFFGSLLSKFSARATATSAAPRSG